LALFNIRNRAKQLALLLPVRRKRCTSASTAVALNGPMKKAQPVTLQFITSGIAATEL